MLLEKMRLDLEIYSTLHLIKHLSFSDVPACTQSRTKHEALMITAAENLQSFSLYKMN